MASAALKTAAGGNGLALNDYKGAPATAIPQTFPAIGVSVSASDQHAKKQKEAAVRAAIMDRLTETGEKERYTKRHAHTSHITHHTSHITHRRIAADRRSPYFGVWL